MAIELSTADGNTFTLVLNGKDEDEEFRKLLLRKDGWLQVLNDRDVEMHLSVGQVLTVRRFPSHNATEPSI